MSAPDPPISAYVLTAAGHVQAGLPLVRQVEHSPKPSPHIVLGREKMKTSHALTRQTREYVPLCSVAYSTTTKHAIFHSLRSPEESKGRLLGTNTRNIIIEVVLWTSPLWPPNLLKDNCNRISSLEHYSGVSIDLGFRLCDGFCVACGNCLAWRIQTFVRRRCE